MPEINYAPDPKGIFTIPDPCGTTFMTRIAACIGSSSSGSGSGVVSNGVIDPVAAPTNPAVANWNVNTVTGTAWIWPAGGAAWQQIV